MDRQNKGVTVRDLILMFQGYEVLRLSVQNGPFTTDTTVFKFIENSIYWENFKKQSLVELSPPEVSSLLFKVLNMRLDGKSFKFYVNSFSEFNLCELKIIPEKRFMVLSTFAS